MDAQTIGSRRRSRASLVIVLVALAIAVTELTVQASSIWSTTVRPHIQPAVQVSGHGSSGYERVRVGRIGTDPSSLRETEARKSGRYGAMEPAAERPAPGRSR